MFFLYLHFHPWILFVIFAKFNYDVLNFPSLMEYDCMYLFSCTTELVYDSKSRLITLPEPAEAWTKVQVILHFIYLLYFTSLFYVENMAYLVKSCDWGISKIKHWSLVKENIILMDWYSRFVTSTGNACTGGFSTDLSGFLILWKFLYTSDI